VRSGHLHTEYLGFARYYLINKPKNKPRLHFANGVCFWSDQPLPATW
jgi:hypothetical protein